VSGETLLEVERELDALYGSSTLCRAGVVHVTYAARDRRGRLCPLRIGNGTPRSETDFFVLSLCRARADALLTSAENVRREPTLSHRLGGRWAQALAAYRRDRLGKPETLDCAILTRSGDLPSEHPLWSDGTRKTLLTSPERVSALRARFAGRADVVGLEASSSGSHPSKSPARSACAWLRANGAELVSVEAGPSTAAALYAEPPAIDELLLTVWEGAPTDADTLAGALPEDARLFGGLSLTGSSRRSEGGHTFRFERWARAART
jgi:riboflavin biosynthesis pyrimidine reductase